MLIAHSGHVSEQEESVPTEMEVEETKTPTKSDTEMGGEKTGMPINPEMQMKGNHVESSESHPTKSNGHLETMETLTAPNPKNNNLNLMNYGLGEISFVLLLIIPFMLSVLKQKIHKA